MLSWSRLLVFCSATMLELYVASAARAVGAEAAESDLQDKGVEGGIDSPVGVPVLDGGSVPPTECVPAHEGCVGS